MLFDPIRVHQSPARRSSQYYVRRLQEGVRAFRAGVRNTPLTRTLERWMEHQVVFMVGNREIPGAWEAYAKIWWEYVDAIDAEDAIQPYRFQKDGETWTMSFSVEGTVKQRVFNDHRGFHHYAQLLANPHRVVESVQLAGEANKETLALIESERRFSDLARHDDFSLQDYKDALEFLKDQHQSAKLKGDIMEMDHIEARIERFEKVLWPGKEKGVKPSFMTLGRQKEGKSKRGLTIHKTVATAMRRAVEKLIAGGMDEMARFLEMTVNPEGYGFAFRPLAPSPEWLL